MKLKTCVGFATVVVAALAPAAWTQVIQPTANGLDAVVVHAELPPYPTWTSKTPPGLVKTVRVKTTIDDAGRVVAASAIEGWLWSSLETTVRLWQFAPVQQVGPRDVTLTFIFTGTDETEAPTSVAATFDDPFTVRLHYNFSTLMRLSRVAGTIPDRWCPIHDELMQVDIINISYGLMPTSSKGASRQEDREDRDAREYSKAVKKLFPNAVDWVSGGCVVGTEERSEVQYCESCRRAKAKWLHEHPDNSYVKRWLRQ